MENVSDIAQMLLGIPMILLFFSGPLCLQLLFYLPSKKAFRKTPPPILYWICLALNTAILIFQICYTDQRQDPAEMEAMDAFDTLLQVILWLPSYLGVVIAGIVTTVKYYKEKQRNL